MKAENILTRRSRSYKSTAGPFNPIWDMYRVYAKSSFGQGIWEDQKFVWHGSDMGGEHSTEAYCNAWNSDDKSFLGLAASLHENNILGQMGIRCVCTDLTSLFLTKHHKRVKR
ncbi:unnamed protein product, partial [Meganyctiphanes norvegica]